MKKARIFFVYLLILLMTVSCTQNTSNNTFATTTDQEDQQDSVQLPTSEVPLVTIESYEDYCNFIEKTVLPDDFIYYSQIEKFGEFNIYIGYPQDGYSHGLYQLIDENGFKISLYVDSRKSKWITSDDISLNSFSSPTTADLRSVSDNTDYMLYNDLIYSYVQGKLHRIVWYAENNEFRLCGGKELLGNYSDESETITTIQGLLHSSTVQSTFRSVLENASSNKSTAKKQ